MAAAVAVAGEGAGVDAGTGEGVDAGTLVSLSVFVSDTPSDGQHCAPSVACTSSHVPPHVVDVAQKLTVSAQLYPDSSTKSVIGLPWQMSHGSGGQQVATAQALVLSHEPRPSHPSTFRLHTGRVLAQGH